MFPVWFCADDRDRRVLRRWWGRWRPLAVGVPASGRLGVSTSTMGHDPVFKSVAIDPDRVGYGSVVEDVLEVVLGGTVVVAVSWVPAACR